MVVASTRTNFTISRGNRMDQDHKTQTDFGESLKAASL